MKKELVYLAVPYSHPDPKVRHWRFDTVNEVAGKLIAQGLIIFSPISHSHSIAQMCDLPTKWEFWQKTDRVFLQYCYKLIVLMLPGWQESKGVAGEIEIAKELGLEIEYIDP